MNTLPGQNRPDDGATLTLHPGDVACVERGTRIETLLGSCVAIVMTDPQRTLGAMCHIVHSGPGGRGAQPSAAHADVALDTMYDLLRQRGLNPALCEAYVYGGGNMFPALCTQTHVGERNADWALAALQRDGVRLLAQDVGGCSYRRLAWTVGTGAPEVRAVQV